jgi:hypothetical protein
MPMESAQPKRRGGRAHHSVLEPHFEAIRQWRRQRKTWKEIALLLGSDKGICVTLYAPYRFMRRRLKRPAHWEDESSVASNAASSAPTRPKAPAIALALPACDFKRPDPQSFNSGDYL